jgi:hypothetical protein
MLWNTIHNLWHREVPFQSPGHRARGFLHWKLQDHMGEAEPVHLKPSAG